MEPYVDKIIKISYPYLQETFSDNNRLNEFLNKISFLKNELNTKKVINTFIDIYGQYQKKAHDFSRGMNFETR